MSWHPTILQHVTLQQEADLVPFYYQLKTCSLYNFLSSINKKDLEGKERRRHSDLDPFTRTKVQNCISLVFKGKTARIQKKEGFIRTPPNQILPFLNHYQDHEKGGLSLRGVAVMTETAMTAKTAKTATVACIL